MGSFRPDTSYGLTPLRQRARIFLRADSGFCRETILLWCETQDLRLRQEALQNTSLTSATA